MPKAGMRWRHVVISTHNSWLPGDARGFRTKNHKIHSSGDYKSPPPAGEHAGLHAYSRQISDGPVVIPRSLRPMVGTAILRKLKKLDYQVLAISVAGMHAHIQVELPDDLPRIRHIIGQCKTVSSHAIRHDLAGRVWARDGGYKPIDGPEHQRMVFNYILSQKDAWTWSYKDGFPDDVIPPSLGASAASPEGEESPPNSYENPSKLAP